mmetsp:Transcript_17844/g.58757  ORF Transcript_17844/g.58757 Transcript_17844/m.58757 type:complete len:330 (+) Transcript_17844:404-1393(+)
MRQQPLLDTCHEDVLELEALGAVDRRELHCAARRRALALPLLVERVDVRHQADLVEESVELVHLALSRQAGQLAEVAPPTRLVVAALVQHRRVTTLAQQQLQQRRQRAAAAGRAAAPVLVARLLAEPRPTAAPLLGQRLGLRRHRLQRDFRLRHRVVREPGAPLVVTPRWVAQPPADLAAHHLETHHLLPLPAVALERRRAAPRAERLLLRVRRARLIDERAKARDQLVEAADSVHDIGPQLGQAILDERRVGVAQRRSRGSVQLDRAPQAHAARLARRVQRLHARRADLTRRHVEDALERDRVVVAQQLQVGQRVTDLLARIKGALRR